MQERSECHFPSSLRSERAPQLGGYLGPVISGREPELSGLRASRLPPLIVHVDDDATFLELMQLILKHYGYLRFKGFTSGTEALDFCWETRPAVLITDIKRPGMDGPELCQAIRNDPYLFDLPLIVLSAACLFSAEAWLQEVGATFVGKPCSPFELVRQVDNAVQASGLNPPSRSS